MKRWCKHYAEALNHPAGSQSQELDDIYSSAANDTDTPTDAPTLDEVQSAIRKLKLGRAPGGNNISPEMLKLAPGPSSIILHKLFTEVWTTGRVPSEWKEGIIVSLYKGKGGKDECSSYRPISLLSVPGKVFAHILLARINPLLISHRRPQQSGFTAGRSTLDAILALRLLSEIHREFNQPLHVAYVDLKSAFDSVDRKALWKGLRGLVSRRSS